MAIEKKLYGTLPDGREVYVYRISNGTGLSAEIINYGGIVTKLETYDKDGNIKDVVLGRASLEEYLDNDGYIGAAIGRHANRIAGGEFELEGKKYTVGKNENGNSLHGGVEGFDKKLWAVTEIEKENAIVLTYTSPDGEEGFPGTLVIAIKYSITEENGLRIEYRAVCDRETVCNLTNHSYFNLGGHESGKVYDQILWINSGFYTPNSSDCMPTGEVLSVAGTPFDFRAPKPIGQDIKSDFEQIRMFGGYDHNFAISGRGFRLAAEATCPETGISMKVFTNQPGMQLYTANGLGKGVHKGNKEYEVHNAFCLETQVFPNAMAFSHFPSPILGKGRTYRHITEYRFSLTK